MRHVTGFILGLVLAAVLFAGGGWGVGRIMFLQRSTIALDSTFGIQALAALAGAGLLLGILLAVPAVSPLATGLPGLALLGWTVLLVVSASQALRLIPVHHGSIASGWQLLLTNGVLAVLGAAMVVPLFVPSRWRRRARDDDDDDGFGPRTEYSLLQ
jgi:hypothetical protein